MTDYCTLAVATAVRQFSPKDLIEIARLSVFERKLDRRLRDIAG